MNASRGASLVVCRPFVAREDELAALAAARKAAAQGRGAIVLVSGDAGVGKTRLVDEFRRATTGRMLVVEHAYVRYVQTPLGPFARMLLGAVAKAPAVGQERAADLALLQRLAFGERPGKARPLERIDGFDTIVRVVEALTQRRGLVAIVEDVHFAHAATLELLQRLAATIERMRLLVVATYRVDELRRGHAFFAAVGRLVRRTGVRELALSPLTPEATETLVRAALHGHRMAPAQLRAIAQRSEGNPFFAEELARSSVERAGAERETLPLSIRSAILERLEPLGPDDERVLCYAAAIGRRFTAPFLAQTLARDLADVVPALRRARDLQLVVETAGDEPMFTFRHALVQETLENELLLGERRAVHRRILDVLEVMPSADPAALAQHARAAHDADRTLRYSERAGDRAALVSAFGDAAAFYERALEAAVGVADRSRVARKLAEATCHAGFIERTIEAEQQALTCARASGDTERATELAAEIGGHLYNSGRFTEALAWMQAELAALSAQQVTTPPGLRLVGFLAQALALEGRPDETLALLDRSTPSAWSTEIRLRRLYHGARLLAFAQLAERAQWRSEVAALEDVARSESDPLQAWTMMPNVTASAISLGEREAAERSLAVGLEHADEHKMSGLVAMQRGMRAYLRALHGDLSGARTELETALDALHDHFIARVHLADAAMYLGLRLADADLIERVVDAEFVEAFVADTVAPSSVLLGGLLAPVLAARGRYDDARSLAYRTVSRMNTAYGQVAQLLYTAEIGDEPAVALARALVAAGAARRDDRVMQAALPLFDALVAARAGRGGEAARHAAPAVERFGELDYPLHRARALELCGRVDEAIVVYRQAGAVADLRRLVRLPTRARAEERAALFALPVTTKRGNDVLSYRERQIARLAAQGRKNREIAVELSLSVKTVERHVASIFAKLAIRSRAQIAAYVVGEERGHG